MQAVHAPTGPQEPLNLLSSYARQCRPDRGCGLPGQHAGPKRRQSGVGAVGRRRRRARPVADDGQSDGLILRLLGRIGETLALASARVGAGSGSRRRVAHIVEKTALSATAPKRLLYPRNECPDMILCWIES